MEQPGFFDRLKTRFTQNAAGTTDLSNLTEEQQKLLRRQFIGRLGSSLAQTGDFGAGMEAQAEAAKGMQAQMTAEQQRREVANILNPQQGQLVQPGGVAPPQAPRLLNPASRNPQPGVPAAQAPAQAASPAGGGAQQPSPQQAVGIVQDAAAQRERYRQLAEYYMVGGNREMAKQATDMANAFAAREEYFAPIAAQVGGREVLIQGSKSGGMNVLNAAPTFTDTVRTQEQFAQRPDLYAQWLQGKMAGATRVDARTIGPDAIRTEMFKMDSERLKGLKTQLDSSLRLLPGIEMAFEAADRNDTGALQAALLPIQRYLNPDAQAVTDAPLLAAGVINSVLNKLGQVGGSDTEREMLELKATEPNWANEPETNRRMFALALRAMRELEQDVVSAENTLYDTGSLRGWRPTAYRGLGTLSDRVEGSLGNPTRPAGASRFSGLE